MVTKGPPSFGQFTIWGISLINVLPKLMGASLRTFMGRADSAVKAVLAYLKGCLMAFIGSFLISTNVLILSSVSLKIKRDLSSVPNKFDTAGNLLPFTFSNNMAGPS